MSVYAESTSITSSDNDYTPSHPKFDEFHSILLSQPKEQPRPKTSFQLAHPPRTAVHKRVRIRPRLLLQLQQISHTARPIPVLDVLQPTPLGRWLARKLPCMSKDGYELGSSDLIVVTSGSYTKLDQTDQEKLLSLDDDLREHREIVATVCRSQEELARREGKATIRLKDGPSWKATPLPNGSYDFVATDKNGICRTVRWVLRRKGSDRRVSDASSRPDSAMGENKTFNFSVINPRSRRHPIIASMTRRSINVVDQYSVPTMTDSHLSPTDSDSSKDTSDSKSVHLLKSNVVPVDNDLRTLILITGIWVAVIEGWWGD